MIVDIHVHMSGAGDEEYEGKRCHLSPEFKATLGFKFMLLLNGQSEGSLTDDKVRETMWKTIGGSKDVDKVVLLAMDEVHDSNHRPMRGNGAGEKTQFYTPNECVMKFVKEHPDKLFLGASVHPYRPDAVNDLTEMKRQGAVLVKWIPSSQAIDPANIKDYRNFYRKLADLGLPLLCHVGAEHTIPLPIERINDDSWRKDKWKYTMLNRPDVIIPALQEGVTVIAAHCSLPVWDSDPDYTHEFIRLMYTAKKNNWNLYADISALALPPMICPKRYMSARKIAAAKEIHDRLLLGSDFPVMVSSVIPEPAHGLDPRDIEDLMEDIKDAIGVSNPLDRNIKFLRKLGFGNEIFERAAKVLPLSINPVR